MLESLKLGERYAPLNGREFSAHSFKNRRRCAPPNPDTSGLDLSPDASGFFNLFGAAKVVADRRARSTLTFGGQNAVGQDFPRLSEDKP